MHGDFQKDAGDILVYKKRGLKRCSNSAGMVQSIKAYQKEEMDFDVRGCLFC